MERYTVAFWNLENLFDEETAPRPAYLQEQLAKELKGWTRAILGRKVEQLCSVIREMNGGAGPDLLGVCEVENANVVRLIAEGLGGGRYGVCHHDGSDGRGIEVAFLYDKSRLSAHEQYSHFVLKRTATRDLFQVNFKTLAGGRDVVVIGNHWPSRSGGPPAQSEPYRIIAAETLAYWHERITEIREREIPIVAMGDFNDEPFDPAIVDYALAWRSREKVLAADKPKFYNLMWETLLARSGTLYFNGFPNVFDQFLVSRSLVAEGSQLRVDEGSVGIFRPARLSHPKQPGPRRFGRPSGGLDLDGYSDHYPVTMVLELR